MLRKTWDKIEGFTKVTQKEPVSYVSKYPNTLVTKWVEFKTLIKSKFYPIWYVEDQWI